MEPVTDHVNILTLRLCKAVKSYLEETPGMTYTDAMRALNNVNYALMLGIDMWYDDLESIVGIDVAKLCTVPEFHELIDLEEPYEGYWNELDVCEEDEDEDDDD
jgi:hypothetical protein